MFQADIIAPCKMRELHDHHFDSTVWNDFRFRPDDIVIATYAKSGTTWVQQIVGQLIFGGRERLHIPTLSPWLDFRTTPKAEKLATLEAQTHRRFIKTHLPVDALRFSPEAKYIYVGRDGRDVVWSLHNHHANATEEWYRLINDTPGRVGPPMPRPAASVRDYFLEWLERDGYPCWPFWDHVWSWWELRRLPNVLLVHFADLKRDPAREIRRIAGFLGIPVSDRLLAAVVRHSSFDYMKAHAADCAPLGGRLWHGGAQTFIHKGINGRWRDVLTAEDCRRYDAAAQRHLGPACARWLAHGGSPRTRTRRRQAGAGERSAFSEIRMMSP
jgi:aryl sulfotransferase